MVKKIHKADKSGQKTLETLSASDLIKAAKRTEEEDLCVFSKLK